MPCCPMRPVLHAVRQRMAAGGFRRMHHRDPPRNWHTLGRRLPENGDVTQRTDRAVPSTCRVPPQASHSRDESAFVVLSIGIPGSPLHRCAGFW